MTWDQQRAAGARGKERGTVTERRPELPRGQALQTWTVLEGCGFYSAGTRQPLQVSEDSKDMIRLPIEKGPAGCGESR